MQGLRLLVFWFIEHRRGLYTDYTSVQEREQVDGDQAKGRKVDAILRGVSIEASFHPVQGQGWPFLPTLGKIWHIDVPFVI